MKAFFSRALKALAPTLAIGIVAVGIAGAAGMFPNFPIVGGSSYCGGTATGTSGQVCTTTVPAGPTVVTGNEKIPADTGLSGGRSPQTVLLTLASLNSLPITITTASASAINNLSPEDTVGGYVLIGTNPTSPLNLSLPPNPIQGQRFKLSSTTTIATVGITGRNGASVANAPTVITPSTTGSYGYEFIYNSATTTWYRLQ